MHRLKQLIARNFESFTYFYRYLRYRLFLIIFFSLFVGVLDAFGLSMFLPLLQLVDGSKQIEADSMGKMGFLVEWIEVAGLELNMVSVLLLMVIFFTLKGIIKFIHEAYLVLVQQFFIRKLRLEILNAFNRVSFKFYVTSDMGRIQNTMTGEVQGVARASRNYLKAAEQGILVLVYAGFAFFVDAQFAILVTAGGLLTNILYNILYKHTKAASQKFTKDSHGYQGQIIQHVGHFKYLKATGLLNRYAHKLQITIDFLEQTRRKMGFLKAILMGAREPLMIIVVATVIIIQVLVLDSALGPILISLLFFYRALNSLVQMQNSWNSYLEVSGSLDNTQKFQEELKEHKEIRGKRKFDRFTKQLELRNVAFYYGEELILENINLTIPKNKTVAFVGESGSGKTTLVNILAALMPVKNGDMLIDTINVSEYIPTTYQERIGYITQEPVVFNDTIFNNISFWSEPTPENRRRVQQAMKKAAIDDFVNGLPNGENTFLGYNGVNLSGGQKQRISIARELFKDIDILIMDEATSALDTETEREIQASIDSLKGEYTIMIVAHRLSTIKSADKIVLMKNGRIESVGGYAELVMQNDGFKKMVELQEL